MTNLRAFLGQLLESWIQNKEKTFLITGTSEFTYDDFLAGIRHLCRKLEGLPESQPVGILANKSLTSYAAVLACLIQGRPFVPFSNQWPINRIKKVKEKLNVGCFILDENSQMASTSKIYLEQDYNKGSFPLTEWNLKDTDDANLAYIMMTSGSTGEPKGVCVTRNNFLSFLKKITSLIKVESSDVLSQTYDLNFDPCLADIFLATKNLACLCPSLSGDHLNFFNFISHHKITILSWVPTLAEINLQRPLNKNLSFNVRKTIFTGEQLKPVTLARWKSLVPETDIYNFYGPTECVIWTHYSEVSKLSSATRIPIGRSLEGLEIFISKDKKMWISGDQVAQGYFQDIKLTDERFKIKNGRVWYDTGDLVDQDKDGNFYLIGRKDRQIKIAGQRFDLSEIEKCVQSWNPNIMSVALAAKKDKLPIYIELMIDTHLDVEECQSLLSSLRNEIPNIFLPKRIFYVEKLTVNPHKKMDYIQLEKLRKSENLVELDFIRRFGN